MATEALNELPETTTLPAPTQLKADAEGWARDATTRLGDDYAKIVRALQALDGALETLQGTLPAPSGTRLVFDQDTAPTGWTRDTAGALNDRVLRIVTGARVHGGSWTISGLTVQGHALTVAELAAHNHAVTGAPGITDPGHMHTSNAAAAATAQGPNEPVDVAIPQVQNTSANATGITATVGTLSTTNTGSGSAHTHGFAADGAWRPLHRDMIVASKD